MELIQETATKVCKVSDKLIDALDAQIGKEIEARRRISLNSFSALTWDYSIILQLSFAANLKTCLKCRYRKGAR